MEKEMTVVDVDSDLAKKIEVRHFADGSGFQRKFNKQRMPEMSKALTNGAICPPITVGLVNGKYVLIDGQHRLAAWIIKPFPLKASVVKLKSMDEAIESFIAMNHEQKRVSLTHILSISKEEYAEKVRALAGRCRVSLPHIQRLMVGIMGTGNPYRCEVDPAAWKLAAKVMSFWMDSPKWGREDNVYTTPSVFEVVGYFVGKSSSVDSILKDLQKLDFSRSGPIGRSTASQREMKAIIYKKMAEQVL